MQNLHLAVACSFIFFLGCKDAPATAPASASSSKATIASTDSHHLDDVANRILQEIVTQETTKDVTCWTSFRQLDNFIASKEYSNFAMLAKITAIKALARGAWEKTSRDAAGAMLTAADIKKSVTVGEAQLADKQKVDLAAFAKDLGLKAYKDYRTTSEHWRVLLSVVEDEIYAGGSTPLKALAPDALVELAEVTTRLSLMLLQKSGQIAFEERTPFIEGPQVKRAHAELSKQFGLANAPRAGSPLGPDEVKKRLAPPTLTLIQGKVKALQAFNKDTKNLTTDMNRLAKVPLTDGAMDLLRKDLQSFVHFIAAGHEPMQADNFLSDGQFAPAKLETKPYVDAAFADSATLQLFPNVIVANGDMLLHFEPNPASPGKKDRKPFDITIRDYEQNSVRDTAVHWIVLEQVYKERPFAMDPFAAEYVSEVVSMMMTHYLRRAETLAKEAGAKEITVDIAKRVRDKQYVQVMPKPPNEAAAWTPEQEIKKKAALAKYAPNLFKDVTGPSGLPVTKPKSAPPDPTQMAHGIQQVMGSGIAVGDVNQDGYPDLFVAGDDRGRLYLNKGKEGPGKFVDATEAWGIPSGLDDSKHPIFFDIEGDGDLDLLVIRSEHPSLLLRQEPAGKFADVTNALGLSTYGLGAHVATIFDYDLDGDLDIYVGYYGSDDHNRKGAKGRNLPSMDGRNGTPHQLFRRELDGKYTEVGAQARVADPGWTLAIGAFDYDNDGDLDIFMANDFGPDVLLQNKGDGTFDDVSKITRTDDNGSGMNASFTDVNGDGWLDFYVSNIDMFSKNIKVVYPTDSSTLMTLDEQLAKTFQYLSGNKLYVNPADKSGKASFKAEETTRFEPGDRGWGWTASFFDYENDGDDDMYLSNGWIEGSTAHDQKKQMFINDGAFFYLAPPTSPEAIASDGRSVVAFDKDKDGDLDLIVNNFREPLVLLENTQSFGNHWLGLRLRGAAPNTNAVGARVTVKGEKGKVLREVSCGNGYIGQDEDVVAVGIGKTTDAEVTIRWPNGKVQKIDKLTADKVHEIKQGG